MSNGGAFTVTGIDFPDGVDPLGIWQMPPIHTTAFGTGTATGNTAVAEEVSVWRIELPSDLEEADAVMQSQLQLIDQLQQDLDAIANKLKALDPTTPTHTPFVIGSYDPETVLVDSINALRLQSEAFSTGDRGVDYGALYDKCETLISRFKQVLSHRGRIETRIGGNLVGLTKIDWNGDFETIWETRAAPLTMNVHVRAIRLASTSRLVFLRLLTIVGAGALGLAIKASIPGGQFLLIPAVYKFVRDMLEELKKMPSGD